METYDAPEFVDRVAERLFCLEPQLRSRVQAIERDPDRRHRELVQLTTGEARTLLRALLPACMALGRRRWTTLRLQAALAGFCHSLIGTTDPGLEDRAAVAGAELLTTLQHWLDEIRWHQATRRAGVAWRRPH